MIVRAFDSDGPYPSAEHHRPRRSDAALAQRLPAALPRLRPPPPVGRRQRAAEDRMADRQAVALGRAAGAVAGGRGRRSLGIPGAGLPARAMACRPLADRHAAGGRRSAGPPRLPRAQSARQYPAGCPEADPARRRAGSRSRTMCKAAGNWCWW